VWYKDSSRQSPVIWARLALEKRREMTRLDVAYPLSRPDTSRCSTSWPLAVIRVERMEIRRISLQSPLRGPLNIHRLYQYCRPIRVESLKEFEQTLKTLRPPSRCTSACGDWYLYLPPIVNTRCETRPVLFEVHFLNTLKWEGSILRLLLDFGFFLVIICQIFIIFGVMC
jgi:hypothetical protein